MSIIATVGPRVKLITGSTSPNNALAMGRRSVLVAGGLAGASVFVRSNPANAWWAAGWAVVRWTFSLLVGAFAGVLAQRWFDDRFPVERALNHADVHERWALPYGVDAETTVPVRAHAFTMNRRHMSLHRSGETIGDHDLNHAEAAAIHDHHRRGRFVRPNGRRRTSSHMERWAAARGLIMAGQNHHDWGTPTYSRDFTMDGVPVLGFHVEHLSDRAQDGSPLSTLVIVPRGWV